MSAPTEQASDNQIGTEIAVAEYLEKHPEFFENHLDLLEGLRLPHPSGRAISLVERQIAQLRQSLEKAEHQLRDFVAVARENDALNRRLHKLTLELFDAASYDDALDTLRNQLREQFEADAVEVRLFDQAELKQEAQKGHVGPALFRDFMASGQPKCGRISAHQLEYLFGEHAAHTGSAAVVPLRDGGLTGVLAIGSTSPDRFHPGQGTDFLRRLGDIAGRALSRVTDANA